VGGILEVESGAIPLERFEQVIAPEQYARLMDTVRRAREYLAGRTIWNVNSTANGGGVAEMLRSLVAYVRGSGIDIRWLVIPGSAEFFRVTKRIHNHLQGSPGDGGSLDEDARRTYEEHLAAVAGPMLARVRPGDIVMLHDPQTAGLLSATQQAGARTVWRCHVGIDAPDSLARDTWRFLLPYVRPADAYVFSRAGFAWEGLDADRVWVIPPSIDAFSSKNRELDDARTTSLLQAAGVLGGDARVEARFARQDGSESPLTHRAHMVEATPLSAEDRVVLQVSRWDRLKDPVGVIRGFGEHVASHTEAHLVVAGPDVAAVADDPEGGQVLQESIEELERLPAGAASHVHLAILPMVDNEENASLVNALQRHAEVVVQKSLAEGFGLTVAEAMWKGRPVVASRIGGIQDQIEDDRTGLLLDDPRDLAGYGARVRSLLDDRDREVAIGRAAYQKVRDHFLGPRHLMQYADLTRRLV